MIDLDIIWDELWSFGIQCYFILAYAGFLAFDSYRKAKEDRISRPGFVGIIIASLFVLIMARDGPKSHHKDVMAVSAVVNVFALGITSMALGWLRGRGEIRNAKNSRSAPLT